MVLLRTERCSWPAELRSATCKVALFTFAWIANVGSAKLEPGGCFYDDGGYAYTHDMCCNSQTWGLDGMPKCWDGELYTFRKCCGLHPGDGQEVRLPVMYASAHYLSPTSPTGRELWIYQDLSEAKWQQFIPGLLFKQGYVMFRWMETLPENFFRGKSLLELGCGVGLMSLFAASQGAQVTATDGSPRALRIARKNAEANLPESMFWSRLTFRQLQWEKAQSVEALKGLGVFGPYQLILCSALMYVPADKFRLLLRLLSLVTDSNSEILWGGGIVNHDEEKELLWKSLMQCFEVVEEIDTYKAGHTQIEGDLNIKRLRRRWKPDGESIVECP
eukprot:TRINITY_DN13350_c0_g1_i2.p1 TRINITY_DN13350_c0_g1~~TRINITY_DN13350_c0_g1_i2.p1  ORF type:complete len:332 (+),score=44.27 TRINITY_DN13350_c0_g1_i2:45-1040(+)